MEVTIDTLNVMNATLNADEATHDVVISSQEAQPEAVGFLRELIADSLQREATLQRNCANAVLDSLEAVVRLAWYLSDARAYLAQEGQFEKWVSANFNLGLSRCRTLRRLGARFARDIINAEERKKLGINPPGLDGAIGPHLRNQIPAQARSLQNLLAITGIIPAPQPQLTNGNGKERPASGPLSRHFANAERLLESLRKELNRLDPCRLEEGQRHELASGMRKLLAYYQAIKDS